MPKDHQGVDHIGRQPSGGEAAPRAASSKGGASLAAMFALESALLPLAALADPFGPCAHQRDLDQKIESCIAASRSTAYPWILQWVYRELARAHRELGEIREAIARYQQSLAAQERDSTRREMDELTLGAQRGEARYERASPDGPR